MFQRCVPSKEPPIRSILILLLLAVASSAGAQPATIAPGEGFEVESYAVALRPDLASMAVSGTETIVVRGTSDRVAQLSFTANALRISEATVDGTSVQASSGKDAIVFSLPRMLRKGGKATLRFRIAGKPARGVTAVAGGIYTSYFACDWMVCLQDAPGDKAHLALDLILPVGRLDGSGTRGADHGIAKRSRSSSLAVYPPILALSVRLRCWSVRAPGCPHTFGRARLS